MIREGSEAVEKEISPQEVGQLFNCGQGLLHQDSAHTHETTMETNYLTQMSVKTVRNLPAVLIWPPWLLDVPQTDREAQGRLSEDVEEMSEAVTEALGTFTLKVYQQAFRQ